MFDYSFLVIRSEETIMIRKSLLMATKSNTKERLDWILLRNIAKTRTHIHADGRKTGDHLCGDDGGRDCWCGWLTCSSRLSIEVDLGDGERRVKNCSSLLVDGVDEATMPLTRGIGGVEV